MSKYKTMDEWYKEVLEEGRLWKDTKISTAEYRRRVQEALRNPETLEYSRAIKKKFGLYDIKEKTIEGWGVERQRYYWMQQFYIVSGRYERKRFELWKKNYIKTMKVTGISEDTIKAFNKTVTFATKDLIDLLPTLQIFYFQPILEKENMIVNEQENQVLNALQQQWFKNTIKRRVYMRNYRASHREHNRAYMRAYMKAYRTRKKNK